MLEEAFPGCLRLSNWQQQEFNVMSWRKKIIRFTAFAENTFQTKLFLFCNLSTCSPTNSNPPRIQRFQLSSVRGKNKILPLDLGGFGISRYTFDFFLYEKAKSLGVIFYLKEEVEKILFDNEKFFVKTQNRQLEADIVIGAFGKRSKVDIQLDRSFIQKRSPYVGVKYHIKTDHPDDLIALHNFDGGYCGISNVEEGKTNLCYLTHRENVRRFKSIKEMEEAILFKNPFLKNIFTNSQFLFDKPETINEISFETKLPVEAHILMTGDAAGMITPLCGNGMAMAIHSAKIVSDLLVKYTQAEKIFKNAIRTTVYRRLE